MYIGESYATDRAAAKFVNVIGQITRESLNADLAKARYYSILNDGITDVSTTEQELVYVLFLQDGTPVIKFMGVESPAQADAEGLQTAIETSFSRIGISRFPDRLVGLNIDGASVNMGVHAGLGAKVCETAPWLVLVHCFNHHIELAIKDAFDASAFSKIDKMLRVLHSLYNVSPKRYRELKQLAEAWETSIPKPTKATGTRWFEHKVNTMKIALEHYGSFLSHIESLSQTDSNPVKRAELKGYLNRWKSTIYPIYHTIYLDILSPIRRLSLGFHQELHNPVKAVRRIREFSWTMVKLHALIDKSLNEPASRLTHYKRLLAELETGENDETVYQGISLTGFNVAK
jgi:hypothetical protein